MSKEVEIEVQGSIREDMVETAVKFLNNPTVMMGSTASKENFLRRKGCTNEEIRIAFSRSNKANLTPYIQSAPAPTPPPAGVMQMPWFQRLKDILLIAGASYGMFYVYKNYISSYLFGDGKKDKKDARSVGGVNEEMIESIRELKDHISRVQTELERVLNTQMDQQSYFREISQLKSEVATVKGILLSPHKFPSVGLSTASIPAWQLTGAAHKVDKEMLEGEDVEHNSGSSEAEIVRSSNHNGGSQGSDSSLELIKEVEP